jgi:glycosyltransferase XagB
MLIRYRPISPLGADVTIAFNPNGRIAGQPRIASASADSILTRMRGLAQRLRTQPGTAPRTHEYTFLVGRLMDHATLERAEREAERTHVAIHAVLLAAGWVSQADYAAALARVLGIEAAPWDLFIDGDSAAMRAAEAEQGLPAVVRGRACRVLSASSAAPSELGRRVGLLRSRGLQVMLAPQSAIDAIREVHGWGDRSHQAVRGLLRERPTLSAGRRTSTWQIVAAAGAVGTTIGGAFVVPEATIAALTGLMALPFLCVTLLRLVALRQIVTGSGATARRPGPDAARIADHALPVYTVLVPLLREGNVLPDLVQSLRALDYPAAKLDVLLILEADDTETQAALLAIDLPGNFRSITVPVLAPQTKPKALNYALQFARGDFVVVYDAEDRPEPGQLRQALQIFLTSGADLVCVQAQLNIDNPYQSWLTRQFTIEYSVLFDAILPALERLRMPVPLGGTSNHFPGISPLTHHAESR